MLPILAASSRYVAHGLAGIFCRRGRVAAAVGWFVFAVFKDEVAPAEISRLAQRQSWAHGLTGKPILAERLHVSLHNIATMLAFRLASPLPGAKLVLQ